MTQGLVGAALAQSAGRRVEIRLATLIGFGAGLLADADVLIQTASDPLLQIEYHRHFTHSLFFIPLGALVAALILWLPLRTRLPFPRIYFYALLGYSLAGFLDVCTSYGTYWLWPLIDERISFNIISIVDPLFTIPLLVGVIFGWHRQKPGAARVVLLFAASYLLLGAVQQGRALDEIQTVSEARGHSPERLLVKPTMGNLLLWRSVYEYDGMFYVDAVRVGAMKQRTYPGGKISKYQPESDPLAPKAGSILARDISRFQKFSDGFVTRNGNQNNALGDIRYSMLPTALTPLWGIEYDPAQPEQHASYHFYRQLRRGQRQQFLDMLMGL